MGNILEFVVNKYNNTIHPSTNHTPNNAHKDSNSPGVVANLTLHSIRKRKFKTISVADELKFFMKGKGNYASRKETKSKWSKEAYKVKRDISINTY